MHGGNIFRTLITGAVVMFLAIRVSNQMIALHTTLAFVERTEVDSLAVGVGTSHGVYKGIPRVNVECLSAIRKVVDIPLVLHGTSGVPDEQVRDCVSRGICKVNYATDLRIAFTNGVKVFMAEHPDAFDPKKYSAVGMERVKAYVMQKVEVVGSVGKA